MSVTINGTTYEGTNIRVSGRTVVIDGKTLFSVSPETNELHIKVTGTLHNLDAGGSVDCQDVTGNVDAGGSVHAGNVGGSVDAGGSVHCGAVGGDIDAGGSVRHG